MVVFLSYDVVIYRDYTEATCSDVDTPNDSWLSLQICLPSTNITQLSATYHKYIDYPLAKNRHHAANYRLLFVSFYLSILLKYGSRIWDIENP